MSRLSIYSTAADGSDRVYLDAIGNVAGLRYLTCPNGDLSATWQMQFGVKRTHRALAPGRIICIPIGVGLPWCGRMGNPRRGDVWEFNAQGAQWIAGTYSATAPTSGNALKLDEVFDAAQSRGLPWTRPAALPTVTAGTQGSGAGQLNDSFNTVMEAKGKTWLVGRDGTLTAVDQRPSNVAYLLQASDTAGGRTVLGFVTDVVVTYLNASTYQNAVTTRSATARPYGRFEQPLDLTSMGPISTSQAQAHGDAWLSKRGARLDFTAPFAVTPGQLLNLGGQPVDLATVKASDGLVRVLLTDPDTAAGELSLGTVQITPGQTEYDVDADLLSITPIDHLPTGIAALAFQ